MGSFRLGDQDCVHLCQANPISRGASGLQCLSRVVAYFGAAGLSHDCRAAGAAVPARLWQHGSGATLEFTGVAVVSSGFHRRAP